MTAEQKKELHRMLITANHILHHHGVLDAYGHVSARHPTKPDVYIMSGDCPPALIESSDDLLEYWILDSQPVSATAGQGYKERFIHGEIYKRFHEVQCVVHSHDDNVMPFATSGVPFMPVFHMAGFLGQNVPVFDIVPFYEEGDPQDMLISGPRLGGALAEEFSGKSGRPDHAVVVMRRHGFTTIGSSIPQTVYRAIYTSKNAAAQFKSIVLRDAFASRPSSVKYKFDPNPLTAEQVLACQVSNEATINRPWRLWCKEVEHSTFYSNNA